MKVGLNQVNKPAPVWFRRLRDASINFLLPALGQLVTSLNLTDEKENLWLQVLTFLPAAFNFVGVLLGDDVKRKVRVWVLVAGAGCLLSGCKSVEKLAAERAQQERDLLRTLQGRYADSTILAFPLTVPGGMVTVTQQTPCPDFDSGSVKSSGGVLTVTAPCPDKQINVDSLIRNNPAFIAALAGRALAEMKHDSTAKALSVSNSDRDRYKDQRNAAYWWLAGIAGAIGLYFILKSKLGAVTGLFKGIFT